IQGNVEFDLTILQGDFLGIQFGPLFGANIPIASGPPLYLFDSTFDLGGFNTPSNTLSLALGNGEVTVPGGASIDTSAFTANSTAVIQTTLTDAAGAATQTNIFDPDPSGSATAIGGQLNVEVIDGPGTSPYTLPAGFDAGILEPGAGSAELDGNAGDSLLAAAPGPGQHDILKSGGHDTLVG